MRALTLVPVWIWLLVFVAAPAAILAAIALASPAEGIPPFALGFDTGSLATLATDPYYRDAFFASLRVAALSAAICLVIGYPMALAIARSAPGRRPLLLVLVILPFWTGFLLRMPPGSRCCATTAGSTRAAALGLIAAPVPLLHTDFAMIVGIVYAYLPFMVLPLEARLARADPALEQAAADLGASRLRPSPPSPCRCRCRACWRG